MTSESNHRLALLAALVTAFAAASRAEDPLLGRIKMIQCVGCTPGSVDLVIHDPIDVRDFQVRINEADYQKIITPLAGKTVYDKEGCFYWMDAPKPDPKAAPADAPKGKDPKAKGAKAAPAKKGAKTATAGTSAPAADSATVVETSAPPPTPEVQGTPSRCIPFTRVEPKPSASGRRED